MGDPFNHDVYAIGAGPCVGPDCVANASANYLLDGKIALMIIKVFLFQT